MGLADAAEPFVVVRLIYRSVSPRLGPTLDDDEKRLRVVKSCLKSKGDDRSDAGHSHQAANVRVLARSIEHALRN